MDHIKRFNWARKHIKALEDEVGEFLAAKPDPYSMGIAFDRHRSVYCARIYVNRAPPAERWSLMLSDAIHALRSTLDNLAFALCVSDLGRNLTQSEAQRVQFVIADSLAAFEKDRDKRREHLPISDRLWAGFERAQPYHGRHPGTTPYLTALRNLSNVDKHRRILVVAGGASDAGLSVHAADGSEWGIAGWRGVLVDKAEVFTFDIREPGGSLIPPEDHPPMHVKGHFTFDIHFEQSGWPGYGGNAMGFLRGAANHIEDNVFRWMERLL